MHSYDYFTCNDWFVAYDLVEVKIPKPHKVIGVRRRYHDSTIPHLDFR